MTAPLDTTNLSLVDLEQLLDKGRSLVREGQVPAALESLLLALPLVHHLPAHRRLLGEYHAEIGEAFLQTSRPEEALPHLKEALRLFEEIEGTALDRALCLPVSAVRSAVSLTTIQP
jgi:hypothetical protein